MHNVLFEVVLTSKAKVGNQFWEADTNVHVIYNTQFHCLSNALSRMRTAHAGFLLDSRPGQMVMLNSVLSHSNSSDHITESDSGLGP